MSRLVAYVGTRSSRMIQETDLYGKPLFNEDGSPEMVIDYDYENRREIVVPGFAERIIEMYDPPGFSKRYTWGGHRGTPVRAYATEMTDADAAALLSVASEIFVDVTDDPEWEQRYFRPVDDIAAQSYPPH